MKKFIIPILVILAFAGIALAAKMDDKVGNPLAGIKKKVMRLAEIKSVDTITIKVHESGHLLSDQVMISVSAIIVNSKVGNGAQFQVSLPHGTIPMRKRAGSRVTIQVNGVAYFLDLVSVSKNSATFRVTEREAINDES